MHLGGFILHGWSCYYNDGEVVKKNILLCGIITIKTFKQVIKIAYDNSGKMSLAWTFEEPLDNAETKKRPGMFAPGL